MNVNKTIFKALVALMVIMLGVNFNAEAQLGGLLNKAKEKVAGGGTGKNQKEVEAYIEQMKAFVPKPGQTPNATIKMDGKEVATWDGAKNELTLKTNNGGFTSGTVLKVDGNTGKITDASGKAMGSLSATAVESPNLGVLQLKEHIGNYSLGYTSSYQPVSIDRLRGYDIIMQSTKQEVFGSDFRLPIHDGNKPGKGTTIFIWEDQEYSFKFADHTFVVSDNKVGSALPIYVASLMMTQVEYTKAQVSRMLGYDPEKTYTTKELEDMIRWKDDETEAQIKKIEEGKTYGDSRVKGAKVAAIGLKSEWSQQTRVANQGKLTEYNYKAYYIDYWVVYELPDGKNKVAFYTMLKNWNNDGAYGRDKCTGFHDVTDWVRK